MIRYGEKSRFADLRPPFGGALAVLIGPSAGRSGDPEAGRTLCRPPVGHADIPRIGSRGSRNFVGFFLHPSPPFGVGRRGATIRSMAQIGHATGYDVQLLSPDTEDLAAIDHLTSAAPTHLTTPDAVFELGMLDAHSAFLTLFHDHDWEPRLLRAALKAPARFIGSLGSCGTHDLQRETLRQMGTSEKSLARLRGPIGLVPSLRDASSNSISAMAEIVATFQNSNAYARAVRTEKADIRPI